MSSLLGVTVQVAASAEEAIRGAEVAIAATNAPQPVIHGDWLRAGCHINAIGANRLETRELDDAAVGRCAFVATDSIEQAKEEGGDLLEPIKRGRITWDGIHEIGDVVAGKSPGGGKAHDNTLFKSPGIAKGEVPGGGGVVGAAPGRRIGQSGSPLQPPGAC